MSREEEAFLLTAADEDGLEVGPEVTELALPTEPQDWLVSKSLEDLNFLFL